MVEHGSTGFLVPPGDPAALATSLIELLKDPGRAAKMGEMGRLRVEEEFELNTRVLSEIKIYEDYLAGNR